MGGRIWWRLHPVLFGSNVCVCVCAKSVHEHGCAPKEESPHDGSTEQGENGHDDGLLHGATWKGARASEHGTDLWRVIADGTADVMGVVANRCGHRVGQHGIVTDVEITTDR